MSSEKKWVDSNHYRVTSDDGKTSYLYKADGGLLSSDSCVEIADHGSDGKTRAYHYDGSLSSEISSGGRGKPK